MTGPDTRAAGGRRTLFLCGDVMTGRGIDQVLPHPSSPELYEGYILDAREYVALAEQVSGRIARPMAYAAPWGEALAELERVGPDVRLINLETAVTTSATPWPGKGIHYRMHPKNLPCLTAARVDCCALANNHVLDWGYPGLGETLALLHGASIRTAGAGRTREEAWRPAELAVAGGGRVLVFSYGTESSGVYAEWAAGDDRPGVALLSDLRPDTARAVAARMREARREGDVVVASIHWGDNWGYAVPDEQRAFAHALLDAHGADVVHGHSSHHPRGIEVYRERLVLYGCGDFLNDYEGIGGYEAFRPELTLMYFVTLEAASGRLLALRMVPLHVRGFCEHRASGADARWLATTLAREGRALGTRVHLAEDGALALAWG